MTDTKIVPDVVPDFRVEFKKIGMPGALYAEFGNEKLMLHILEGKATFTANGKTSDISDAVPFDVRLKNSDLICVLMGTEKGTFLEYFTLAYGGPLPIEYSRIQLFSQVLLMTSFHGYNERELTKIATYHAPVPEPERKRFHFADQAASELKLFGMCGGDRSLAFYSSEIGEALNAVDELPVLSRCDPDAAEAILRAFRLCRGKPCPALSLPAEGLPYWVETELAGDRPAFLFDESDALWGEPFHGIRFIPAESTEILYAADEQIHIPELRTLILSNCSFYVGLDEKDRALAGVAAVSADEIPIIYELKEGFRAAFEQFHRVFPKES